MTDILAAVADLASSPHVAMTLSEAQLGIAALQALPLDDMAAVIAARGLNVEADTQLAIDLAGVLAKYNVPDAQYIYYGLKLLLWVEIHNTQGRPDSILPTISSGKRGS